MVGFIQRKNFIQDLKKDYLLKIVPVYSIFYTPESEDNLTDIFEFISNDNTFYAAKVLSSINNRYLKIIPIILKAC